MFSNFYIFLYSTFVCWGSRLYQTLPSVTSPCSRLTTTCICIIVYFHICIFIYLYISSLCTIAWWKGAKQCNLSQVENWVKSHHYLCYHCDEWNHFIRFNYLILWNLKAEHNICLTQLSFLPATPWMLFTRARVILSSIRGMSQFWNIWKALKNIIWFNFIQN